MKTADWKLYVPFICAIPALHLGWCGWITDTDGWGREHMCPSYVLNIGSPDVVILYPKMSFNLQGFDTYFIKIGSVLYRNINIIRPYGWVAFSDVNIYEYLY